MTSGGKAGTWQAYTHHNNWTTFTCSMCVRACAYHDQYHSLTESVAAAATIIVACRSSNYSVLSTYNLSRSFDTGLFGLTKDDHVFGYNS